MLTLANINPEFIGKLLDLTENPLAQFSYVNSIEYWKKESNNEKFMKKTILLLLVILSFQACKQTENAVAPEAPKYGTITGRVTDAKLGVPVVQVNLKSNPSTSSVSSDSLGNYRFDNIEPGDYVISASKAGFDSASVSVKVIAGTNTTGDIFMMKTDSLKLVTTGIISGKVISAENSQPLANVLINTSPSSGNVITGTDGSFLIKNVNPGLVTVVAYKTGFDSASTKITVVKAVTSLITLILAPKDTSASSLYGTIQGYITDGMTGQPLAGATVYSDPSTSSVLTDNTGKYLINNVLPGRYKITVAKNGYTSTFVNVNVLAGKTTMANLEILPPTGRIKGQVTDSETGSPLAGVNIKTNPGTSTVTTNSNGDYEIPQVSAGTFTLTAEKNGYVSASVSVTVKAGVITSADIVMKRIP